jgi:Flp pilus assembly protein TadG
MSGWLNRFARCRRGVAAVELALSLPVLTALIVGLVEVGRALSQANAVERGLRTGVLYAARSDLPFDAATQQTVQNLVTRGSISGGANYVVPEWADAPPTVNVSEVREYSSGVVTVPVPIIRVTATVQFVSLLPGLLPNFTFTRWHEQAYIGR